MNKGFTLIELMVTIAIFALMISAVFGIFVVGLRQQKIALQNQIILDQTSFALEFMSRALRMAKKESGEGCLSSSDLNYELISGGSGVRFINVLDGNDCQEFFLENEQLKYKKETNKTFALTSSEVQIKSLKFNLIGQSESDLIQPRLTVSLVAKSKVPGVPTLKIQTTVSQRNLDVPF